MAGARGAQVEAAGWGWRHAGRRHWAVRGLDLRIEPGERVLLLGASGSGKSTLLLGLAGLLDRSGGGLAEGRLQIDGLPAAQTRESTAIVFQDSTTQLVMARAGDDVAFGLENRCVPPDEIWPRVDAALEAVGFRYGRERATAALSGGEQQRLALAGALALRPRLLLLDEPTANLDPDGAALVRSALDAALRDREVTMVLVEHRVAEALPLVDRVVVIEPGGGVMVEGAPGRVFGRHADRLLAAGVWVPGRPLEAPPRDPRPPGETLLLADQVGFRYPGAGGPALQRVDLGVRAAEALAISGPNGAGKTTLALLLGGLLRPTSGQVMAGEALEPGHGHEPIWRWPARQLARRIGSVFQSPEHQFLAGTLRDELRLGPMQIGLGVREADARSDELLARLGLERLAGANPFTLSGGEARRLSVATALASAPAVLVLDEPTFGQDRGTASALLGLLAATRDAGRAVVVISHDRDFTTALADRTLRLVPPPSEATTR